jgi:hypothetical protein
MPCFSAKALERRRTTLAVKHPAAGDQNRALGLLEDLGDGVDLEGFGRRLAEMDNALGEELFRPVGRHRLHILRQRQRHRAALGRIGEHGNGARQGGQQLMRRDDAVEIARNRDADNRPPKRCRPGSPRPAAERDRVRAKRKCRPEAAAPAGD